MQIINKLNLSVLFRIPTKKKNSISAHKTLRENRSPFQKINQRGIHNKSPIWKRKKKGKRRVIIKLKTKTS